MKCDWGKGIVIGCLRGGGDEEVKLIIKLLEREIEILGRKMKLFRFLRVF